ncbi:MAG TPA: F0F1 ATP synthase subunit delta [Lysobacter sp.]|nr:F0F1 ATP synthase subunit delta [Lysobacter sp.]
MSQPVTLARPYARAAFALAREHGRAADWSRALAFAAHVAADPQVQALLKHPHLSVDDAVSLVAIDGADEDMRRFFGLLAENRRLALLPEVAGLYEQLRADAERIVKARVTAATGLTGDAIEQLRAALRRRFGREVVLETAVDPSLLGGAVIDAGDVVIDGSLKGKLARLRDSLAA